jgi:peroxiredoxin
MFSVFTFIAAAPCLPLVGQEIVQESFIRIQEGQEIARTKYRAFFESAAAKDQSSWEPVIAEFLERTDASCKSALALAKEHPSDALSYDVLKFVVDTARGGPADYSAQAFGEILEHHSDLADVGEFCMNKFWISDFPETEQLMRRTVKSHPDEIQRAYATYALANLLIRRCEQKRNHIACQSLNLDDREAISEVALATELTASDKEISALLEEISANYDGVPYDDDYTLAQISQAKLNGYFRLRLLEAMPNITGKDSEGTPFSLDEYSGQVVVVIFTGDWCGNCKVTYPFLRKLQNEYAGQGLTILGVSTDAVLDTLKQSRSDKEITWRCWWDNGFGEIVKSFGISAYPTILVIDRKGTLCFKNLREKI